MNLRRLFLSVALALGVLGVGLVARVVAADWDIWRQSAAGRQALVVLRHGLSVAEMASRERGPTNAALGAAAPTPPAVAERLRLARERTDQAVEALQQALLVHEAGPVGADVASQPVSSALQIVREQLRDARRQVDVTLGRPLPERSAERLRADVARMVSVIPALQPALANLSRQVTAAHPRLADLVQGARLAADLREQAGQLGSHFTAPLARRQPFTDPERIAINRSRGRIDSLHDWVDQAAAVATSVAVSNALDAMHHRYFGRGGELVDEIIEAGLRAGDYRVDPGGFAAAYVPEMDSILIVRDALLDEAQARAAADNARALRDLGATLAVGTLLLGLLGLTLWVVHHRVIRPLGRTATAVTALAGGDLDHQIPRPGAEDEFADVLGALEVFKRQARERAALAHERDALIERLRAQSDTDYLTGLPNRRAFDEAARRLWAQSRRHGHALSLVLFDVDRFKSINDQRGHEAGDEALVAVARLARDAFRQGDLVARHGGEEFAVLMSHCALPEALDRAEDLRRRIAEAVIDITGQSTLRMTASFGVVQMLPQDLDLQAVLRRADRALYAAKAQGRDRVEADPPRLSDGAA
jgi:diguanylate cyclase (GGDEF)-like protein